ncbi:MAG TPA: hypothetical protein VMU02_02395 [bacterium]|nr:hypothetical protein [bacterium]
MKTRFTLGALAVLAAALAIAGCSSTSPEKNGGTNNNVISDYGGYTTSNEDVGFGDPGLIARCPEDTPFDDEMANSPEVAAAARNGGAKFYMLRMVWGNIDSPDTTEESGPCGVTDWSGGVQADGGVVIVSRLIRFEHDDHIVRPRRGATGVQWVSHTRNNFDGVLLEVIDVPGRMGHDDKNTLTITTPFYTAEIPFDSLATFDVVNTYDDCNRLALVGQQLPLVRCPRGFLEGSWLSESDTSGSFAGAWIGEGGKLVGYVHGRYGFRDAERVLFGKWINASGDFGGLLKGTWGTLPEMGHHDGRRPDGYFEGTWVDDALTVQGDFRGHYSLPAASDSGSFHGMWIKDCK